jgi:hypothetical protein
MSKITWATDFGICVDRALLLDVEIPKQLQVWSNGIIGMRPFASENARWVLSAARPHHTIVPSFVIGRAFVPVGWLAGPLPSRTG